MAFLHSLYIDFWALSIPIVSTAGINWINIIDDNHLATGCFILKKKQKKDFHKICFVYEFIGKLATWPVGKFKDKDDMELIPDYQELSK